MANLSLDVFNSDAFGFTGLTAALDKLPYKPKLIGSLNIFEDSPQYSKNVFVEEQQGKLTLLPTAPRGTVNAVHSNPDRIGRNFVIPHIPYFGSITADDLIGIREFGTIAGLETAGKAMNMKLKRMKDDHETTFEFHRVNAIKGILVDADNSTVIYNYFTQFGTSQQTANWAAADADFGPTVNGIIRLIGTALGNETFGQVIAICGDTYFDGVVKHASVKAAYERWVNGEYLRVTHLGPQWYSLAIQGFMYQGVLFINYRGTIGDVIFVPLVEAYYFPTGVPEMFIDAIAPADFMECAGMLGQRFYAKREMMKYEKGVDLHTQSNILSICTRPRAVIKSTYTP